MREKRVYTRDVRGPNGLYPGAKRCLIRKARRAFRQGWRLSIPDLDVGPSPADVPTDDDMLQLAAFLVVGCGDPACCG